MEVLAQGILAFLEAVGLISLKPGPHIVRAEDRMFEYWAGSSQPWGCANSRQLRN